MFVITREIYPVWRCANVETRKCSFFLWVVHEPEAKEWLKISRPNSDSHAPAKPGQTPMKGKGNDRDDSEVETPFTKAKRRRKEPADSSKEGASDAVVNEQNNARTNDPFTAPAEPETPNKGARASDLSTPTSRFAQKLKINGSPLYPTIADLSSFDNYMEHASRPSDTSPILAHDRPGVPAALREGSDLTSTVLDLIRAENVDLKPSTKIQIRHEIDLVVDVGKAKVQRYEETIQKLHERIEELEKLIVDLVD